MHRPRLMLVNASAAFALAAAKDAGHTTAPDPKPDDAPDHTALVQDAADARRDMQNAETLEDVKIQLTAWADRLDAALAG